MNINPEIEGDPPKEKAALSARMIMAQAFAKMLLHAYDALLHFSVNYRNLPAYKDQTLLEEGEKLVVVEGRNKYLLWIERLTNAISAAVRRAQFKLHHRKDPDGDLH